MEAMDFSKLADSKGKQVEMGKYYRFSWGSGDPIKIKLINLDARGLLYRDAKSRTKWRLSWDQINKLKLGGYLTRLKY